MRDIILLISSLLLCCMGIAVGTLSLILRFSKHGRTQTAWLCRNTFYCSGLGVSIIWHFTSSSFFEAELYKYLAVMFFTIVAFRLVVGYKPRRKRAV